MDNPFEIYEHKLDSLFEKVDVLKNLIIHQIPHKEILTIEEVQEYTLLKQPTILKHKRTGKLRSYKQAGRLYFRLEDIIKWLTENQIERISTEEYKKRREKMQEKYRHEAHENFKKP